MSSHFVLFNWWVVLFPLHSHLTLSIFLWCWNWLAYTPNHFRKCSSEQCVATVLATVLFNIFSSRGSYYFVAFYHVVFFNITSFNFFPQYILFNLSKGLTFTLFSVKENEVYFLASQNSILIEHLFTNNRLIKVIKNLNPWTSG